MMKSPFSAHQHIQVVASFAQMMQLQFQDDTNAVCWSRQLHGDFHEIVTQLELHDDMTEVSIEDLNALALTEQGKLARNTILQDIQLLTACGASPTLNLIKCYQRDDELDFISTDVYSFHVDRASIATDTILCTYYGAASDIVPNAQVTQKILLPKIRAQLQPFYEGSAAGFEQFLTEYFFDLHYQAHENAQIINLGVGHIWRLAVDHPEQQVLPCVHRAPYEQGDYRLLLIC